MKIGCMHCRLSWVGFEVTADVPAVPAHPTTAKAPDVLIPIITAEAKVPASTFRQPSNF